jgi:aldose 1-epimerase
MEEPGDRRLAVLEGAKGSSRLQAVNWRAMKDESPIKVLSKNELRIRHFSKSGRMTPGLIGILCFGLLTASVLRGKGNAHKLRNVVDMTLNPPIPDLTPTAVSPGGQNPIKLTRSAVAIGKDVEFLSTTLLPGRGMSLLQITAMIPGHGEVPLLIAPEVDSLGGTLTGKNEDENGEESMSMGGAFLLPWAGRLSGSDLGHQGIAGDQWQGKQLTFPVISSNSLTSTDGLFLNRPADAVKSDVLPDGQFAQATFHAKNFGGHWPSTVDVTVTVELSAHTLDLTVLATNTGNVDTPFAIGWHPLFAIPSGNRSDLMLSIPSDTILDVNKKTGVPSGRTMSTQGTPLDFNHPRGTRLGSQDIDATYVKLETGIQDAHPVAEMRDAAYNLSLKVIPLSSNISNLHVVAPADKKSVSIDPATNLPDAFGPEWKGQESGMTTLTPGQTMSWKVRIEIAPLDLDEDHLH